MKRDLLAVLCLGLLVAAPAMPQEAGQAASDQQTADEQQVRRRETIEVGSASKTQQALIDAPATMSVVTADTIASSPAQNYGDLLRSVPGLNVTQTSARDINMTSRQNTTSLTNSQLVLAAGRSARPGRRPGPGGGGERGDEPAAGRPSRRPGSRQRRPYHLPGRLRRDGRGHPHRQRGLRHPERCRPGLRGG